MPYKQKLKNPSLNPRKKPQYKVANWTEYNQSLKRRGELSLYFPEDITLFIKKVIADGGYYSKEIVEKLCNKGIIPAIPPPSHAVVQGKETTKWHDKIVQYIKDKGTVYAFYKKYSYGIRALVEAQISRIKRCIGHSLKTQKI